MALSPMMQQYMNIKEQYKDSILLYRLGDFYEMFFDDAVTASRVLELTLTGRDCGLSERAPMCGVPYHAVDSYVAKLIDNGYKVAICEQTTRPGEQKGIVERKIVREITPGTKIDEEMLVDNRNNYLMSIYCEDGKAGVSWVDISTGELNHVQFDAQIQLHLNELLARIAPSEIICNGETMNKAADLSIVKFGGVCPFTLYDESAFVYDNAASLKGKGIDFAMDRLTCHLQRYYRKHGTDGWALVFDFSDYFNSAPHAPIYAESERRIRDERVRKLACGLMEDFGERGFGLGSQVSQIDALMLPNRLDHFIKEQLHIEGYGRYMDDGYLIHESRDYLQECLKQIRAICADLGIRMNEKKTRIVKLQELHFLKTRSYLTETGKVRRKMCRKSARRMRRKLKTFRRWMAEGRMTEEDIRTAYESWHGHMRRGNSYRVLRRMDRFYKRLMEKGA